MLLAVDWSGDPGVKPGSLPRCVMAVVACEKDRGVIARLSKIASGNSEVYDVIQVADMVCGAINEAAKRQIKEGWFLEAARDSVTVLRITPNMEKPAK